MTDEFDRELKQLERDIGKMQREERLPDEIAYINQMPMERLRFQDFRELKAGRDEMSKLRHPALRERVGVEAHDAVEAAFDDDRHQATCFRWLLRGLNVDKAIRKVKTDAEVSENAAIGKAQKRLPR